MAPDEEPEFVPGTPLPVTFAVRPGSFARSRLRPSGIVSHFAAGLREAALVQGVLFPVPEGVTPRFAIELSAADGGSEPDSNFWLAALAYGLFPAAPFVYLQNDYSLELQALVVREREIVATYRATAQLRNRYQINANKAAMEAEGLDLLARRCTRQLLAQMSADRAQLTEIVR